MVPAQCPVSHLTARRGISMAYLSTRSSPSEQPNQYSTSTSNPETRMCKRYKVRYTECGHTLPYNDAIRPCTDYNSFIDCKIEDLVHAVEGSVCCPACSMAQGSKVQPSPQPKRLTRAAKTDDSRETCLRRYRLRGHRSLRDRMWPRKKEKDCSEATVHCEHVLLAPLYAKLASGRAC